MIKLPLNDSDGATLGVVGWSEDITRRVEVEASLERQRRLIQALVEIMPHPVSYIDRDRRLRMVNRAWCELVGMSREEALGKTILEIDTLPRAVREGLWKENDEIYRTGKPLPPSEYGGTRKDGQYRIAQVTKAPLLVGGMVDGVVTLSIDVTDIRQAEQAATLAQQRMHDALESIPAAIYLYDAEDKLLLANSMAKSMYPTVAAMMTPGTTFTQLVTAVAQAVLKDPQERAEFVSRRLTEFHHIVRQVEQRGPGGEYLLGHDRRTTEGGTVSIRFDITEQKRIQQALEKRERETRAELMLAGQVQRNILQAPKPRPFIVAAHEFRPSSFVSGDIFHSSAAEDGSFLFFLGDATGHGVSAALITMLVKATLATIPDSTPMQQMAEQLNSQLLAYSLDGMYMSGIFIRITPSGDLTYTNAGHPAALVVGAGKDAKLESSGPPMGWFEAPGYESATLRLAPGDKVVLLTDGLTEWANTQGEQLGSATVERVAREHAEHTAQGALDALLKAAKDHGVGEQNNDDLSLFVFEYRPRFG
jgi:PAS domain S-box-containing protein